MYGQPIAKSLPSVQRQARELNEPLRQALARNDAAAVRGVVEKLAAIPGYRAGFPDLWRAGLRSSGGAVDQKEAVALFRKVLKSQASALEQIAAGREVGSNMLRMYADVARGCVWVRPYLEDRSELDGLIAGACSILLRHQTSDGFFPFPDLRGKNIRFGEMTEKLVQQSPGAIRDGWIVVPDPDGGTQFDTGQCGMALLEAGQALGRDEWKAAGLKAAQWARGQSCAPNFNYNAFSVSLLATAFRITGQREWLTEALAKWRVGVAPGQVSNGRWVDPHNARTVYHCILLRGTNDLAEVTQGAERAEVDQVRIAATQTLAREFSTMGVTNTSFALRELQRAVKLGGIEAGPLQEAVRQTRAAIRDGLSSGGASKGGTTAFTDVAALVAVD